MPARVLVGLAGLLAVALTALVVGGTITENWVLVSTGASLFGGLVLLVEVDTWRRTRELRKFVRAEVRRLKTADEARVLPPPPTQGDVLGAVQLIQAEYSGRLDRMQAALESALSELPQAGPVSDRDE